MRIFAIDKSGSIWYKSRTLARLGSDNRLIRAANFNKSIALKITSRWLERRRRRAAQAQLDEIAERAARLGITPDRVLEEYRRIAFANLSHIVHWGDTGMSFKPDGELDPEDVAAICEIVESAKEHKLYRVKLYDKRAALDAIARYLGMNLSAAPTEDESTANEEDPREALIRELDRLAAKAAKGSGGTEPAA